MRLPLPLLACLAALMPCAAPAQYQMVSPMLYEGPRISLQSHARQTGPAPSRPRPETRTAKPVSFRYTPDPARRRANLSSFVARTRTTDPASADQLAALFASGDILAKMQAAISPYGLRIDDVADAYAVYWINAWQATKGRNDTPDRATLAAVRAQAARAMQDAGAFVSANDATRQHFAEALWIQAALLDGAVEKSKGKPDQLRAIGRAAAEGARTTGIDLSAMTLTESGFVTGR